MVFIIQTSVGLYLKMDRILFKFDFIMGCLIFSLYGDWKCCLGLVVWPGISDLFESLAICLLEPPLRS